MNKIIPEHLSRGAIVYIRQSTPGQVANNLESKRRQYGLADRARQLGWQEVTVIDDDQGHSASGIARVKRPGLFKELNVRVSASPTSVGAIGAPFVRMQSRKTTSWPRGRKSIEWGRPSPGRADIQMLSCFIGVQRNIVRHRTVFRDNCALSGSDRNGRKGHE